MSLSILELGAVRARWRRARAPLRLVDPQSEDFGTGGLARFVEDVGVRFLVLPADPELAVLRFDEAFWPWWMQDRPDPFDGAPPTDVGRQSMPTATAAVRFDQRNRRWEWFQYTALLRSGGLELGLGSESVHEGRTQEDEAIRGFHLTRIVGRIWHGTAVYSDVLSQFPGIEGPWEATLALIRTHDAMLGDLAAGWDDFGFIRHYDLPRCQEPNLMFCREIEEWPSDGDLADFAYTFGEMIEGAWASKNRRWLIPEGRQGAGTFDVSRYR